MENMDYDLRSIHEARTLAKKAKQAANEIANYNEEEIEKILKNMVKVAEENLVYLAEMAVEETGFGVVKDKAFKNHLASTMLYDSIKNMKTIDVIEEDIENKITTLAEPMGMVMGIVPSTNPTSTAIFKSIIAIKSRNSIVFSPHPSALKCTSETIKLMHDAAVEAGAPNNIISGIVSPSIEATNELMKHKDTAVIIATGGPGMVKAAYSSGKPALGVGAGNSPSYIEKTANIEKAVKCIIASKTFDNGTVCASEQSVIVEECNRQAVIAEFKKNNCYFMTEEETKKVSSILFRGVNIMNAQFVGRDPQTIADAAGISIPTGTKILIGHQNGVGKEYPLSYEKLTTVLAFYTVKDSCEASELSDELLQNGLGHTMNIHTEDKNIVMKFSKKPAARILVNTGGSQGGTGASTGLLPSFTLGCGTWGGSSISDNVGPMHLVNIKKIAYGIEDCNVLKAPNNSCDYQSPQYYANKNICNTETTNSSSDDKLNKLMKELLEVMKGDN